MNCRKGILIFSLSSFLSFNSFGAALCNGYEAVNLWPEYIKKNARIRVQWCCARSYSIVDVNPKNHPNVRLLQMAVQEGGEIEIYNPEIDTKKAITYLCSKDSPLYGKCIDFPGAYINSQLDNGLSLRIYHEPTDELMKPGGNPPYYGFRVIKGLVDIRGAEEAEKLCEAKKSNGSKLAK